MYVKHITPILNVSDIPASLAWFEKLGWKTAWTWNDSAGISGDNDPTKATFASVGSGKCEIFLCKNAQGSRGGPLPRHTGDDDTGGVWMSWFLGTPAEVDAAHAKAREHGMTVTHPPTDELWGVREFHLRHPDGHTFRVGAPTCPE